MRPDIGNSYVCKVEIGMLLTDGSPCVNAFWNHFTYGFEQGQRTKLKVVMIFAIFNILLGAYLFLYLFCFVCKCVPPITEVTFWQIFTHEAESTFLSVLLVFRELSYSLSLLGS